MDLKVKVVLILKLIFIFSAFLKVMTHHRSSKDKMKIEIDDWKDGKKVFLSSYIGDAKIMESANLLKYFFKYPNSYC